MRRTRRNQIEAITQKLLIKHELFKKAINVKSLAAKLNIKVFYHDLSDDISGLLIINDHSAKIGINKKHADVRKRFTIAHELGHYCLGHSRKGSVFLDNHEKTMSMRLYRNSESSTGENIQEQEANAFAASLLMPTQLIADEIDKYSFDLTNDLGSSKKGDDIDNLAKSFKVSSQAMAFRLSGLGYFNSIF